MSKAENDRDDAALAALVRNAGYRPPLPDDMKSRMEDRFRQELRMAKAARSRRRASLAAAAVLVAGIGTVVALWRTPVVPTVASTMKVEGHVEVVTRAAGTEELTARTTIEDGAQVTTAGDAKLLAKLGDTDTTLRLDGASRIEFIEGEIRLQSGSIYIDTGLAEGASNAGQVVIRSREGRVADIGTQFMVTVTTAGTAVAVREGMVDITTDAHKITGSAGAETAELVTIDTALTVTRDRIDPHGEHWGWIQDIAPDFHSDDPYIINVLRWVARESGRTLAFASEDARRLAERERVYGSLVGFTPEEALATSLKTTDLMEVPSAGYELTIGLTTP